MPKSTVTHQEQYKLPKETLLPARLKSVKEEEIPYRDKKTGEERTFTKWIWEYEIIDGEYAGLRAWGDTQDSVTDRLDNKPRQWIESLLGGISLELGQGVDTDDYLGLECMIEVEHREHTKANGEKSYLTPVLNVYPADSIQDQDQEPPF